ncbi:DUF305 domain-containing protein [Streptomonospora nanhaiensis]|uniref:Uncharacterized protein (DUF305 family) n=1 Tax=Streptomonospora nanhaiensis TaxID=1323731 RepID=A0A853BUR2_9ACTN|nr:DUF305 domain-containing protein [Streptomonospora nanhaiensis]MBX9389696.1 DUF305 domain-containing protein [Streptomonospora nanhaiensis]NYI98495.1 uncharacterized protein (DUF305 family) [Streptomonospora nanhaiensis]
MRKWVVAVGAAIMLTGVSACSGDGADSADGPPVLAPGAPGESASPASQEQIDEAVEATEHNEADVEYILKMIEHHGQALVMTDLAEDRMANDDLAKIADRIAAAQGPEVEAMEAWMEENVYGPAEENPNHQGFCANGPDSGGGHHGGGGECPVNLDHSDMPGMASEAQLDELRAAEGEEFDELFVELMTAHHEGAIEMAEEATMEGKDPTVLKMANDVIAEQRADIERMEEVMG